MKGGVSDKEMAEVEIDDKGATKIDEEVNDEGIDEECNEVVIKKLMTNSKSRQ